MVTNLLGSTHSNLTTGKKIRKIVVSHKFKNSRVLNLDSIGILKAKNFGIPSMDRSRQTKKSSISVSRGNPILPGFLEPKEFLLI